MGRASELVTAGIIAASAISAMIWWPDVGPNRPVVRLAEDIPVSPDTELAPVHSLPVGASEPELPAGTFRAVDLNAGSETFGQPGELADGQTGLAILTILAPDLRFPLETGPAFANSQGWGPGGFYGPAGDQCSPANYTPPWQDTFCESGGGALALCPAGQGHAGQDIRPSDCQDAVYWAVAAGDGVITSVGRYSVRLMGDDGTRFTYLHLDPDSVAVEPGERIRRGERIGRVSHAFGGTPATIHLHFEMRMAFRAGDAGLMSLPVPPYSSVIDAYQRLQRGEDDQAANEAFRAAP